MKVILLENIDRLGKAGDIVNVKEGFARNYLLPKDKAKQATAGNMKLLDALKKKRQEEENKVLEAAKSLADKLSNFSLTISALAGEEDKLFGSVSSEMIQNALAEENIKIDKKDILLDEHIGKLGVYQVTVRLHPEVKSALKVWIVKK